MEQVSKEIRKKSYMLIKENRIKKTLETDKRIHFTVKGETENHSVIFNKEKNEWTCDCKFVSLKQKICSHILAAKLKLKA